MSDQNSTGGYGSQDPYSGSSGDPWFSGSTNQDAGQPWSSRSADGGSTSDPGTSGSYGSSWSDGSGSQDSGWSGHAGTAASGSYTDPYASQEPAASTYDAPQFGQGALPYGGPPQPVYVPAAPTNPLAVTSMILGIVSIACMPLVGPVGLVLAILGMKQTATSGEQGRGMAIAGLVLGYLEIVLWFVFFAAIMGFFALGASQT